MRLNPIETLTRATIRRERATTQATGVVLFVAISSLGLRTIGG
jgi:hypothetical protein